MTLIEIARQVAVNVGLGLPSSVQGDDPDSLKLVQFINETGADCARRVDWNTLSRRYEYNGTGSDTAYTFPPDYMRLCKGLCATVAGAPIRGSLTADEWAQLAAVAGTPRYFRSSATSIRFYPMLADDAVAAVLYQSTQWAETATGDDADSLSKDSDVSRLPGDLLVRGAIWRFMRHVGREFSDQMSEYEAMLADYASAETGARQP